MKIITICGSTKYEMSKADELGKEIIFYNNNKLGVV